MGRAAKAVVPVFSTAAGAAGCSCFDTMHLMLVMAGAALTALQMHAGALEWDVQPRLWYLCSALPQALLGALPLAQRVSCISFIRAGAILTAQLTCAGALSGECSQGCDTSTLHFAERCWALFCGYWLAS